MSRIIHLVDSIEYATSNCFQKQLTKALQKLPNVVTVPLAELSVVDGDRVVCCLKQRTLFNRLEMLAIRLQQTPVRIYDQDPWHSYMDDSPFKGVYELATQRLNVETIAVTSQWWVDRIRRSGMHSSFVPMWISADLCSSEKTFIDREIDVGFIGSLHLYRHNLFEFLESAGLHVDVSGGNHRDHNTYLQELRNIAIYVRTEDGPIQVNGERLNLRDGLWGRDIEVASQGCFSIRNRGQGHESYLSNLPVGDDGQSVVRLFDQKEEIPSIVEGIQKMDVQVRQSLIDRTVEYIKGSDRWQETATTLTTFNS